MILAFVFILPTVAAVACLALNRAVATRTLAALAALAYALAAGLLVAARALDALAFVPIVWLSIGGQRLALTPGFDAATYPPALLTLAGGAVALAALAAALPAAVRRFGGLVAALALALQATLLGLAIAATAALAPIGWSLATLLGSAAVRTSGVHSPPEQLPRSMLAGLFAALLLCGAALLPPAAALACLLLAALLAIGAPPFHAAFDDLAAAPGEVAAPLLALGLPLLAVTALARIGGAGLTPAWQLTLVLAAIVTVVACAAGALGERRPRRLVGWMLSAQLGTTLAATAVGSMALVLPLALGASLAALAAGLAAGQLERHSGSDDLEALAAAGPLPWSGLAWLLATASAIGVPGMWGFWARADVYAALQAHIPWAVAPLLAGSALLGVAALAPLATFWRVGPALRPGAPRVAQALPLLATLPLAAFGIAPWLAGLRPAPGLAAQIGSAAAVLVLLAAPLALRRLAARRLAADPDSTLDGVLTPRALSESLRWLAWLADPAALLTGLMNGLVALAGGLRRALSLLEQRYFIAGLVLGMVILIFLVI